MANLNVYLNYNGDCEAAFNLYKSVFGGEFAAFSRFNEMPPSDQSLSESEGNKIMHVALPIGSQFVLMGSDCPPHFVGVQGNLFNISINAESKAEAETLFNGLSEGGVVTMPLEDTFWGAYFGMFSDKFGVNWMVNYDYPKP